MTELRWLLVPLAAIWTVQIAVLALHAAADLRRRRRARTAHATDRGRTDDSHDAAA